MSGGCASEILQVQHLAVGIVGKDLGVPAPIDKSVEHPLRLGLGQVVLELAQKARSGGGVAGALVQDPADMGGERDVLEYRLGEKLLACEHVGLGIGAAEGR